MTITITFRGMVKLALACLGMYLCLVTFILFDSFFTCWTCGDIEQAGFDARKYAIAQVNVEIEAGSIKTKSQADDRYDELYKAKSTELERSPAGGSQ